MTNSGTITGKIAVGTYGLINTLSNTGTINGGIALADNAEITNLSNTGTINGGTQLTLSTNSKVNIAEWKVTIDATAADFNDLSKATVTGNPSAKGYIVIKGASATNLTFSDGAIKVGVGTTFEEGKEYNVSNVIISEAKASLAATLKLTAAKFADGDANDMVDLQFKDGTNSSITTGTSNTGSGGDNNGGGSGGGDTGNGGDNNGGGGGGDSDVNVNIEINTKKSMATTYQSSTLTNNVMKNFFIQNIIAQSISSAISISTLNQLSSQNTDYEDLPRYANLQTDLANTSLAGSETTTYHAFVLPYYNYTRSSYKMDSTSKSESKGILAGFSKDFNDPGVFGAYLGYVRSDLSANYSQYIDENSFSLGLFHQKNFENFYLKTNLDFSYANSDIERGDFTSSANNTSYGIGFNVGKEFSFGSGKLVGVVTPEVGISYQRYNFDDFTLSSEYYNASHFNLFQLKASLSSTQQFTEKFNARVEAGLKGNLNRDLKTKVNILNSDVDTNAKLAAIYAFAEAGVGYNITDNITISLNYGLVGSKNTISNTGYARFDIRW